MITVDVKPYDVLPDAKGQVVSNVKTGADPPRMRFRRNKDESTEDGYEPLGVLQKRVQERVEQMRVRSPCACDRVRTVFHTRARFASIG